jgi:hypothetical protein
MVGRGSHMLSCAEAAHLTFSFVSFFFLVSQLAGLPLSPIHAAPTMLRTVDSSDQYKNITAFFSGTQSSSTFA